MFVNTYRTVEKEVHSETKEKASKFISYIFPCKDDVDVKTQLLELKNLHPKATHICYAYRLGTTMDKYRANDDGEPSGTAGKPILGQIDSHQLTNVLIAVVRYYGGTKLGVSGLIQAYKESAAEAIMAAVIIEKDIMEYYVISVPIADYNLIIAFIKKNNAILMQQIFEKECLLTISVSKKHKELFFRAINEFYQVNLNIKPV